jgi:hypothetical protein
MLYQSDETRIVGYLDTLRTLRNNLAANRPNLVGADDAIDDALAALDSAAADMRYALITVQDALGDIDATEAGYRVQQVATVQQDLAA